MSWDDSDASGDDWEAGGGGMGMGGAAAGGGATDSEEEEEDETLLELQREKEEAERKAKEGKPSKTFDEIMAERKARDAARLAEEKRQEEAERQLTPEEQLARMRAGLKAAEEADNALTAELFGVAAPEKPKDTESQKAKQLEALTLAISQLTLQNGDDFAALASTLTAGVRAQAKENPDQDFTVDFLETLLGEVLTTRLEAQLGPIGDMLNAAQSTADALEAKARAAAEAKAKAEAAQKTKADGAKGEADAGKAAPKKRVTGGGGADTAYEAFAGLDDSDAEKDDDSEDESSEDEDGGDGDFM